MTSKQEIQENFDYAVEQIKNTPSNGKITDAVKLQFYALYKQATVGKCNTAQPYAVQFVERAKWDAWNALGSMSQDSAKTQYCELYLKHSS